MAKKVFFYGPFNNFEAQTFVEKFDEIESEGEDAIMRMSTNGGDPMAGYGMLRTLKEFPNKIDIKVDGEALSMGAYFLLYASEAEALNTSQFLIHRAASFMEDFDKGVRKMVVNVNKDLRAIFEKKIDVAKFEEIGGVTLDRLFDVDEEVIDVVLTAKEAKDIGLINKIFNLETGEIEALNRTLIEAKATPIPVASGKIETQTDTEEEDEGQKEDQNFENLDKMNLAELKAKHPEVYNEAVQIGIDKGMKAEKDRVESFMEFADIDINAVKSGIEGGEAMSEKEKAKFTKASIKAMSDLEDDSADDADDSGNDTEDDGGEDGGQDGGSGTQASKDKEALSAFKEKVYKMNGIETKS